MSRTHMIYNKTTCILTGLTADSICMLAHNRGIYLMADIQVDFSYNMVVTR